MSAFIQAASLERIVTVYSGKHLQAASKNIALICSAQSSMDPFCIASAQSIRDNMLQSLVASNLS